MHVESNKLRANLGQHCDFSLTNNATKVDLYLSVNHKFKLISGANYPDHYVQTAGYGKKKLIADIIKMKEKIKKLDKVIEVKIALVVV